VPYEVLTKWLAIGLLYLVHVNPKNTGKREAWFVGLV
jgi:hypothetical protein